MSSRRASNAVRERLAAAVCWGIASVLVGLLSWILLDLAVRGLPHVSWRFLLEEPTHAGRGGGIGPLILATLLLLLVTMATAVPLALATAIWLSEISLASSPRGRIVRRSLDTLAAVPSIVFGLFGNAFFCLILGWGYSILSGGMTLACMVLPILTRVSEEAIRAVPAEYRQAAAALGLSRTTTMFRIILPAAAPALAAGMVLGIGRALAETAALIFTAGYVTRKPASLFDSGRALSVHIYDMAMNVPGGDAASAATAAVLIALLLIINAVAVALVRYAAGNRAVGRKRGALQ